MGLIVVGAILFVIGAYLSITAVRARREYDRRLRLIESQFDSVRTFLEVERTKILAETASTIDAAIKLN